MFKYEDIKFKAIILKYFIFLSPNYLKDESNTQNNSIYYEIIKIFLIIAIIGFISRSTFIDLKIIYI